MMVLINYSNIHQLHTWDDHFFFWNTHTWDDHTCIIITNWDLQINTHTHTHTNRYIFSENPLFWWKRNKSFSSAKAADRVLAALWRGRTVHGHSSHLWRGNADGILQLCEISLPVRSRSQSSSPNSSAGSSAVLRTIGA